MHLYMLPQTTKSEVFLYTSIVYMYVDCSALHCISNLIDLSEVDI